ncbi:uncharacterized protein SCHCODRAFT_02209371 [Schizophyllum commune H4-8]|uniref:uncharacterized protein n=1 Tax=Schizophyllum commune (strain H4-8 / FGSC 9210) TaxID=578458 RepID=UPI00215E24D7|nr:uncharacterized protein SCHCODRAFT_02209371 [Schizophyllum commune H4-8]KAI5897267.1 hypothetical protein SCHCODRAFT_02209371 [Schizophyllum commune H4-8]
MSAMHRSRTRVFAYIDDYILPDALVTLDGNALDNLLNIVATLDDTFLRLLASDLRGARAFRGKREGSLPWNLSVDDEQPDPLSFFVPGMRSTTRGGPHKHRLFAASLARVTLDAGWRVASTSMPTSPTNHLRAIAAPEARGRTSSASSQTRTRALTDTTRILLMASRRCSGQSTAESGRALLF